MSHTALAATLFLLALACSQAAADAPTLNVLAPGINARGSDMFEDMAAIRKPGQTYRIELVAGPRTAAKPGLVQYLIDSDRDPAGPRTIRIQSPDDPALAPFLRRIMAEQDATVVLDMDLVNLGAGKWKDQTGKLATLAARVAEERLRTRPDSVNTILAHSAGTVGLSKLINAGKGGLYQTKIAASPMTWQLSPDVLILQASGDLPSTATGAVADLQLRGPAARNAAGWLGRGNTVIHVSDQGLNVEPSLLYRTLGVRTINPVEAHQAAHKLGVRDRDVQVLIPVSQQKPGEPPAPMHVQKFAVANVSPGQVIRVLEGTGGPSRHGPETDRRRTDFDRLKERIEKLQPPKGGGIALRAVARLPVSRKEITGARWEESSRRLILVAGDRPRWRLPPMDLEIARAAYRCVFGPTPVDPEFSLGIDPVGGAADATAAGRQAAYYVGPIDHTLLGLVLCQADIALGEITYGGSRDLAARGLDRIQGYHSLPELFPAKYTDQPQRDRHLGVGERVVIQSLPTELVSVGAEELAYVRAPELAVRFGRTTPAERAYADLFGAHYFAILERVSELRDLVECARVVGVFKWLRENGVSLEAGPLASTAPRPVITPHQVAVRWSAPLEGLAPRRPLVVYGEYGPTDIFDLAGGVTRLSYEKGRLKAIARGDGRHFQIHTDDLGNVAAVELEGVAAAAFVPDATGFMTVLDGVTLERRGASVRVVGQGPQQGGLPAEPLEVVNAVARRFLCEPR